MAFLQVNFFSAVLEVGCTMDVILPEEEQGIGMSGTADSGQLPRVLYLLHGYSDDHTIWQRRTSIERYVSGKNLAVIMPAVDHSFYCNEKCGKRYWDFISQELPKKVHSFFKLSEKREDTFVAGLSMGGYGSLKLALNYPERFAAAACFSGVPNLVEHFQNYAEDPRFINIFGSCEDLMGSESDLMTVIRKTAMLERKPRLYVTCGTADFLYSQYCDFVPMAKELGFDVTAWEKEGAAHEWSFWDESIQKVIDWLG